MQNTDFDDLELKRIPLSFEKRKSDILASWRKVKIPKTSVTIYLAQTREYTSLWGDSRTAIWEFGQEATLGEVFDKYTELLREGSGLVVEMGADCLE